MSQNNQNSIVGKYPNVNGSFYIPVPKDVYSPPLTPLPKNPPTSHSKLFPTLAPSPEHLASSNQNSPVLVPTGISTSQAGSIDHFFSSGSVDYYALFQQQANNQHQIHQHQHSRTQSPSLSAGPFPVINPVSYASIVGTGGSGENSPDFSSLLRSSRDSFSSNSLPACTNTSNTHHPISHNSTTLSHSPFNDPHVTYYHDFSSSFNQGQGNSQPNHHHPQSQENHAEYANYHHSTNNNDYNFNTQSVGCSGSTNNIIPPYANPFANRGQYICSFKGCDKSFDRLSQLRSHTKTHSLDKPYICDTCHARFSRNHDLKRHQRIHSGIRPFVCEHCGKSFIRLDALSRHLKVEVGYGCKGRVGLRYSNNSTEVSRRSSSASETLTIPFSEGLLHEPNETRQSVDVQFHGSVQTTHNQNLHQNKISPDPNEKSSTAKTSMKRDLKILKSFILSSPDIYHQIVSENKLRIWVGTWNMHGQGPPNDLHKFIKKPLEWEDGPSVDFHILAISTQECERTIEKSVIYPSKEIWESTLVTHLQSRYSLIKTETMAALHLAVFVLKELKHLVDDVESGFVATGIGNVIGNKGGVGVGFNLADSARFLFINSHLTAHQKKVKERNLDFQRICKEMPLKGAIDKATDELDVTNRFEYTFWAGDLNYRVNGTRKMVDALLNQNMMEVLLANDQLITERATGRVFQGFEEPAIHFRPTYKFDTLKKRRTSKASAMSDDSDVSADSNEMASPVSPKSPRISFTRKPTVNRKISTRTPSIGSVPDEGLPRYIDSAITRRTSVYDSSKKQRIQSWTDRILYKSHLSPIKTLTYNSCMDIMTSDHKPVYGIYELDFNWSALFETETEKKDSKKQKRRWLNIIRCIF